MKTKLNKRQITDTTVENTTQTFHLVFAIAPALAAIVTFILNKDLHLFVELGLIAIVVVANFLILWLRSRTEKNEELSLFYTFWTNKLLPNQSGDQQTYDVCVAIIEDEARRYFHKDVHDKFKKDFAHEKLRDLLLKETRQRDVTWAETDQLFVELQDDDLYFRSVNVGAVDDADNERLQRDFKKRLDQSLNRATAVVLVRTNALDEKSWAYEALSSWGYQNSEIPILFAKDPTKQYSDDQTAKKFLSIPDEPRSLPWHLLQRSQNRAKAWRTQATYNRAMAWNIFYLALLMVYVGVIWIVTQAMTQKIVRDGMDHAVVTERAYRVYTSKKEDQTFAVSYWYRHKGKPYVFVTTEIPHNTTDFENNYATLIGCAFVETNRVIEGTVGTGKNGVMNVTAYDNYLQPVPMPKCQMKKLETSDIKSLVCASYDDSSDSAKTGTVGICVLTNDPDNNLFGEDTRKLLLGRVRQFHDDFIEKIENSGAVALAQRQGSRFVLY